MHFSLSVECKQRQHPHTKYPYLSGKHCPLIPRSAVDGDRLQKICCCQPKPWGSNVFRWFACLSVSSLPATILDKSSRFWVCEFLLAVALTDPIVGFVGQRSKLGRSLIIPICWHLATCQTIPSWPKLGQFSSNLHHKGQSLEKCSNLSKSPTLYDFLSVLLFIYSFLKRSKSSSNTWCLWKSVIKPKCFSL